MAKLANKPSVDEILELYAATEKRYIDSGIFTQFEEDERFYELDFHTELKLPTEFETEGIILPTARDMVDTCTDHTDISNVRVWVGRKGDTSKSNEEQELLRKFGIGVLYRNNVESSISPIRVGAKHYWMHGLTIFKTVWDADRWAGRPEKKDGENDNDYAARVDEWRAETHDSIPIVIQAVNPRNIMLDPFYDGGMFVFETREELCFNVKNKFTQWSNPAAKKITDKVKHVSFWSKDYRCELYDGEPVLKGGVVKHTYGFIPYVAIDTGLGNLSSDADMKKRYVGVLRYVKNILISESRNYSVGDIILKKSAFPWGYLKGKGAAGVKEIFQKFGEYNALPDGVEIVDMQPKVPPQALLTWLSVSSSYLSSHAAPASIKGEGEQGVRSGADRRLLIAEASTRYQYSSEAFKYGIAKVLSNCARIMKNVVPGDISVWAKTPTDEFDIEIRKDKMHEPFTYAVEFSAISEEDEYRRHDDLERLVQSGIVSRKWARKQMSNVDSDSLELEEEVEKLLLDPQIQQLVSMYAAGKIQAAIYARDQAESINNPPPPLPMGGGMPPVESMGTMVKNPGSPQMSSQPRQMIPPIPNVAPLGSGQDMQNKMKQMRSQTPMNATQGRGGGGNRP
jgi:hypothetical protein